MPRTVSAPLQAKFDGVVSSLFYLLQINASSVMRWSNGGDFDSMSVPWAEVDFDITDLSWDGNALVSANLKAQNFDNALASIFLNENLADVTVEIWQVDRDVPADPQKLGTLVMDDTTIGLTFIKTKLVASQSARAKSPRRRVDAQNGFKYPLPKGTQIVWGNETYIVGEEGNG